MRTILTIPALLLAATAAAAAPDLAAGRRIAGRCAPCHATGEAGASLNPKALPLRDLATKYPLDDLQESLAEGIIVGHSAGMPQFKLTPPQIEDFLAYLASIQAK